MMESLILERLSAVIKLIVNEFFSRSASMMESLILERLSAVIKLIVSIRFKAI